MQIGNVISPHGVALYLRRIQRRRHGSPADFASRCADHGLGWLAIAGPWHDHRGTKRINDPKTVRRYADALAKKGIEPWVWGYPYQGTEDQFAREMRECAGDHRLGLLDPELGSNPTRSKRGRGKARANAHARYLVESMANEHFRAVGLSTFGSGWRLQWFPLLAFVGALLEFFRGRTFIGGQTYTEDGRIDMSIADMLKAIETADPNALVANEDLDEVGVRDAKHGSDIEIVPNFGVYKWVAKDPRRRVSRKNRKAVAKTAEELRLHLHEFVDDGEPVDAVIGWAENFMTRASWREVARFADLLERGGCRLPRR